MNVLFLYDSMYGNTERITNIMAGSLSRRDNTKVMLAERADDDDILWAELLVVGSPTQGGKPTTGMTELLNDMYDGELAGKKVAAFDTRFDAGSQRLWLKSLMKVIGYAAPRIAGKLVAKGGELAADPEGFIVDEKSGPLHSGEIERAKKWVWDLRLKLGTPQISHQA